MHASTRVLLIGIGETALSALQGLADQFDVIGVVRDAVADGGQPYGDDVTRLAQSMGVPLFRDVAPASIEQLAITLNPHCIVLSSYNRILREPLLHRFPVLNVHYGALPRYRGRATVNWAMINDETSCAISIHAVAPSLDSGNILFQHTIPISADDNVGDLYARLNEIQRQHLPDAIRRFLSGDLGEAQNEGDATYCCSRNPDDGQIDWTMSTQSIDCLVRALDHPFPGAFTFLQGRRLWVWKARPLANAPKYVGRVPGRVVGVSRRDGTVDVLTGDGTLRLLEVQVQRDCRRPAAEVVTSVRATLGATVVELLSRIERLEQELSSPRSDRNA